MLKYFTVGSFLILCHLCGYGQFTQSANKLTNKSLASKLHFNLSSSMGFSSDKSYFIQNYFTPTRQFKLHKNFSLLTGIGIINTQWNNLPKMGNELNQTISQLNFTSFYAFANGIYHLNEQIDLNTQVFYENLLIQSQEIPGLSQNNSSELSFGINYKASSNFSFNAQIKFTDRPISPFGYYNNSYTSPFTGFFPLYR
jgi:hypothetical protein